MSWTTILPFWETKTPSQRKKIFDKVHLTKGKENCGMSVDGIKLERYIENER